MATIDRSCDGEAVEAVTAHFEKIAAAHQGREPTLVLYFNTGLGPIPVSICKNCAAALLDCLETMEISHPDHFAELS